MSDEQKSELSQLRGALAWALDCLALGGLAPPPDHACGPESACDTDCMDYANERAQYQRARALLKGKSW